MGMACGTLTGSKAHMDSASKQRSLPLRGPAVDASMIYECLLFKFIVCDGLQGRTAIARGHEPQYRMCSTREAKCTHHEEGKHGVGHKVAAGEPCHGLGVRVLTCLHEAGRPL